ncbi:MAG: acriflavin resistance protein [Campylobacteraceae bacterium 4484_166]|nr:MAG: acriflavin resistance protein [Campylobacteraceae bacterium 4484_166]
MIKYIINFSLKKPILNHMLLLLIFATSIYSYINIPKEIFPPSKLDAISITGGYIGTSSAVLDKLAVVDIEEELLSHDDIDTITTTIKTGYFHIKADLKSGAKTADVVDDIKDIISKTKINLPVDMEEPIVKEIVYSFPLITVAITGKQSKERLLKIAKKLKNQITKLGDLSDIKIWEDSDKHIYIKLNTHKIDAYGLTYSQVVSAISQISSILPVGVIKDKTRHYYLSSENGTQDIDKLNNSLIKISGKTIYLKDICDISYSYEDVAITSRFNGTNNLSIGINKGLNGDSIKLVKQIKDILKTQQKNYPDVSLDTYTDTSVWIKNRLNTVVSNIIFGIILLTIALLFFINFRIAFVVAIGIPTSFMIGLIAAQQLGYSLNMLSLLGALLALGMLVDEAIVVAENIYRHMEMGKDKLTAAIDGAMQIYPAVLTATATTIFAFLPILLLSGETGVFMRILPIMISVLILSSLIEAFFFLPLHANHILKINKEKKSSESFWRFNKNLYEVLLTFALKYKYKSLSILVAVVLLLSAWLLTISKFTFMPEFDSTQIYITGSVEVGNSLKQTEEKVAKIEQKIIKEFPIGDDISSISTIIGMKLDGKSQAQFEEFYFHIFVNLKEATPKNFFDRYINPILSPKYDDTDMTRDIKAKDLNALMQKSLLPMKKDFVAFKIFVPGAGIVKNDIELALNSPNKKRLKKILEDIKTKLSSIDGVVNVEDDIISGNLDLKLKLNAYGQRLGFTETSLISAIKPLYLEAGYAKMFSSDGIVKVVLLSTTKDKKQSLSNLEVVVPNTNYKVALKDITTFEEVLSKSQINKVDSKEILTITASINDTTSADVYAKLQPTLQKYKNDINIEIKGEEKENAKVKKEMALAFVFSLFLIFLSLVWMFDSLLKSFLILSTIPLSIVGVLIGHMVTGLNLTMPGIIGVIGLAGVIVNDGIIMMDFIQKATTIEQLKTQAMLRLRPILLTSLTTILGLSTLIFFASGQALILQPMAVSLGFGLLFATVLNLYYLPMVYRIFYIKKEKNELK